VSDRTGLDTGPALFRIACFARARGTGIFFLSLTDIFFVGNLFNLLGVLYKWGGVGLSERGAGDTAASRWHIYTRSIPFGRDNEQEHSAWLYTFATLITYVYTT
jgi:hypothetical protein